jgi:hypothetical protein
MVPTVTNNPSMLRKIHASRMTYRAAILSTLLISGCYGSGDRPWLERYIGEIRPGSEGSDAFRRLDKINFSPVYETSNRIVGERTDTWLVLVDAWRVVVELDDEGRVVKTPELGQTQNYP